MDYSKLSATQLVLVKNLESEGFVHAVEHCQGYGSIPSAYRSSDHSTRQLKNILKCHGYFKEEGARLGLVTLAGEMLVVEKDKSGGALVMLWIPFDKR